jgi:hypothetical protein
MISKGAFPMSRQSFVLALALATFIGSILATAPRYAASAQATPAAAAGKGPGGKPTPTPQYNVTYTINDFDSLFNPLQLQSDDLNVNLTGTGGSYGIYQTDSSTNVISRIDGDGCVGNNCDGSLYLDNSTNRSYRLTLNRLSGSGPTGTYSFHGHLHSVCFDPTGATTNTVAWFSITNSNPNCGMRLRVPLNNSSYALIMGPRYDSPQPTGRATVTCTQQLPGGSCVAWTIAPNPNRTSINPNPGVANLYSISRNGTYNFVGQYALSYDMNVTYP